jgi:beta-glucanase (GH16 family)
VENSRLILEAHREPTCMQGAVREYSSGRIRTKHRGDWTYGRFEVRAKIPEGRGLWPAIWMLPTDDHYGTWDHLARMFRIDEHGCGDSPTARPPG